MARTIIQLGCDDTPTARVVPCRTASYFGDYISIHLTDHVLLFVPEGAAGSAMARTLAAVLLKVADEYDAIQPAADTAVPA